MTEAEIERQAISLYEDYAKNSLISKDNKCPTWKLLTETSKAAWRRRVRKDI